MSLNILAYGANGAQMGAGTKALADAGHNVRAFTRSQAGADRLAAYGLEAIVGNMGDLDVLHQASEGQDALFLHVPLIRENEADGVGYGLNALRAAKDAGIERVVWNTGGPIMDPASETDPGAVLWRALEDGGFSYLGLTPITYMENLLGPWSIAGLAHGALRYPTPATFKMQWGAAKDFGRVADKALRGDLPNEIIRLGGPSALDGTDLTRVIGEAMSRDVAYETMPAQEFQGYLEQGAGPRVAAAIGGMYGAIQANPDQFQPGFVMDASAVEDRFDLKLTPLAEWVGEYKNMLTGGS